MPPKNRLDNLLGGLLDDRLPALRAMRDRNRTIEDSEVVVYLGDGRDNRARVAARRALLDGNRRREPFYLLDVRLLHPVEELPRIRGKRLDIPTLPFRVKRIERERRLARTRKPRHDRERVAGDRDVDPLEVVDLCVTYDYVAHSAATPKEPSFLTVPLPTSRPSTTTPVIVTLSYFIFPPAM